MKQNETEKRVKKKKFLELEWATAYFPNLSHDTMHCIVTQKGHQATIRPGDACRGDHDTTEIGNDTVGPGAVQPVARRGLAAGLYRETGTTRSREAPRYNARGA